MIIAQRSIRYPWCCYHPATRHWTGKDPHSIPYGTLWTTDKAAGKGVMLESQIVLRCCLSFGIGWGSRDIQFKCNWMGFSYYRITIHKVNLMIADHTDLQIVIKRRRYPESNLCSALYKAPNQATYISTLPRC